MTFADVLEWCRRNQAEVRGIYRGKDVAISFKDTELPANLPDIGAVFHWDVEMPGLSHYASASDFERIVTGRMTIEDFKSTLRRGE
jgi:hypothetical protein